MRRVYRNGAVLGVCLLVASAAAAGTITRRGTITPTAQTIWSLDSPAEGATVYGIVPVRGFVINPVRGIAEVTLLVDGTPVHDADLNQPRMDVRLKYPGFQGETFPDNAGFATSFLASNFADGEHTVAVRVTYADSTLAAGDTVTEVLGERTVVVDSTINQAPLGGIDSPRDPGTVGMTDYVHGIFPVTGWAIDDQGIRLDMDGNGHPIAAIEVMVDEKSVGQSLYMLPRPDVANAYPDVAGAVNSGYQMNLNTAKFDNGMHTISVRAWDILGKSRVLGARTVVFDNTAATTGPIGAIDFPMPNAHLFSTSCQPNSGFPSGVEYAPGHRIEWISGWALAQDQGGIQSVKLYIDGSGLGTGGAALKSTNTDCEYVPQFSPLPAVNCYGLYARPDVLYDYPQFADDAKYSGFFFALDMDVVLKDLTVGLHHLQVRAVPVHGDAVTIGEIPIIVECPPTNRPSFGDLESPTVMEAMQGSEVLKGWVLDFDGVVRLNVYVDGLLDGSLTTGSPTFRMPRADLATRYPFYPTFYWNYVGFEYTLDTTRYTDGVHQIVLETVDAAGGTNYWVQRPVAFDNPS